MVFVSNKVRQSNFEILRIIAMLLIVFHHYNVNSGLVPIINANVSERCLNINTIVSQCMAFGGKMGISVFLLISGYFMIDKQMKWIKVAKLLLQIMFYNIVIYTIFSLSGYHYDFKSAISVFVPFLLDFTGNFIANYLLVYILSPLINKWMNVLSQKEWLFLLSIFLGYFVILGTFFNLNTWNYFGWAFTMYLLGGYIKRFDLPLSRSFWGFSSVLCICGTWLGIIAVDFFFPKIREGGFWIYLIADCNKITVLSIALSLFMFFKRTSIPYHPFINRIAASAFGVLMIHANCEVMRQWLWKDMLDNIGWLNSSYFVVHMFVSCILIYFLCSFIDMLRIKYLENPLFEKIASCSYFKFSCPKNH
jgi:surface polysaccharide O-acyltransferase-like enzyme